MRPLALWILLCVVLTGCSGAPGSDEPRNVTVAFYEHIQAGRGDEACVLVSDATIKQLESQEQKPCAEAVMELDHEGGDVIDVHLFVTNAKVDLSSGESAYLNEESDGWKLSALACKVEEGKPRDRPLECEVEA